MILKRLSAKLSFAVVALLLLSFYISCNSGVSTYNHTTWSQYGGGPDQSKYFDASEITKDNVGQLQVAWMYNSEDSMSYFFSPIVVDSMMYVMAKNFSLVAVNVHTGKEVWIHTKLMGLSRRGINYWESGDKKDKRLIFTLNNSLQAIDAVTGKSILSFGDSGYVDLRQGLDRDPSSIRRMQSMMPGIIYNDLVILGSAPGENYFSPPGHIRAYNVVTGKLEWTFHTIPHPGEFGYDTWPKDAYLNTHTGAANNWAGMAVDNERGILFVPTGSAGYDFYGGNRKGANLFANCLIALDAKTGKRLWHFQTTHHDLWDRDLPAPPNLITVTHRGKKIPAVAQITKQGFVFLFDRVSGKPLFPIVEKKVMGSALKGEKAWLTQPYPTLPKPYARLSSEIQHNDINPYSENKEELINTLASLNKSWHAAPSEKGNLILPGFDGGGEWGGAAADPNGILYVNSNEMAWIQKMVPTKKSSLNPGEKIYQTNCQSCHGADKKGNPFSGYPTLVGISSKKSKTLWIWSSG